MPLLSDLIGLGMPPEQANILAFETVSSSPALSSSGAITAAGTTVADATALTNFVNLITTAALNTGVKLPDVPVGQSVVVFNNGANSLKVYPASATGTINSGTAGAGVTATTAQGIQAVRQSTTNWVAFVHTKAT